MRDLLRFYAVIAGLWVFGIVAYWATYTIWY